MNGNMAVVKCHLMSFNKAMIWHESSEGAGGRLVPQLAGAHTGPCLTEYTESFLT